MFAKTVIYEMGMVAAGALVDAPAAGWSYLGCMVTGNEVC
jgi:hypothetical protein